MITSPVYLNNLAGGPSWLGRRQPPLGQDLRRHWLKARSGGNQLSFPASRLQLLPLLPDNLAAQKTLPRCFRRTTQSISVPVPGSQGDGWLVLARPAAPAPPPLSVVAASPPPEPRGPGCHSSVVLRPHPRRPKQQLLAPGPCIGGSQRGLQDRLERKLAGRQIRVAGLEAAAALEGGDTYWDRWGACLRCSHSQHCFRGRRLRWAVFLYQLPSGAAAATGAWGCT